MPLQATSGAASYDAFGGGAAAVTNYIEDVFSTYLYTGNGGAQTINNGIDLAGKGGVTWLKMRSPGSGFSSTQDHALFQTAAPDGSNEYLVPNSNSESFYRPTNGIDFTNSGFTLDAASYFGGSGDQSTSNFASWSFRKQAKFFDVVYFVGTGSARTVPHNLGSVPGCVIVKSNSTGNSANYDWAVYHQSLGNTRNLRLNTTAAQATSSTVWNNTSPTATEFTVGTSTLTNQNGVGYVALVFAHNAGGFGLTGTDNVISCGSYTGNGSTLTVSLGYEPQWLLIKNATTGATNWSLIDCIRSSRLIPNLADAEDNTGFAFTYDTGDGTLRGAPTATGFQLGGGDSPGDADYNANGATYIYIAIRRPMKTPTTGASVFTPVAYTGTNVDNRLVNTGIVTDMALARIRTATSAGGFYNATRMVRGGNLFLETATTAAVNGDADSFMTPTVGAGTSFAAMNGFGVGNDATRQLNQSSTDQLAYAFQRAPGFFDVVCYTGDAPNATVVPHNLGVQPEFAIIKQRSGTQSWGSVFYNPSTNARMDGFGINSTGAVVYNGTGNSGFTSTGIIPYYLVNAAGTTNLGQTGSTYVAYLFATCPGVSKVFNYTGNGSSQTINCGFTGGARFVLIKRTDSTGDWYVWDSARGIVSGNDPRLSLNTTAAEVTTDDSVDTDSTGFVVNQLSATNINVSSATYIGIAIA